jgi:hypothetical protein
MFRYSITRVKVVQPFGWLNNSLVVLFTLTLALSLKGEGAKRKDKNHPDSIPFPYPRGNKSSLDACPPCLPRGREKQNQRLKAKNQKYK